MAETFTGYVYKGSNNTIIYSLTNGGAVVTLTPVTRITLSCQEKGNAAAAPVVIDSSTNPGFFDWTTNNQELVLKLGASSLEAGKTYFVVLKTYDTGNPAGVRWTSPPDAADKLPTLILRVI